MTRLLQETEAVMSGSAEVGCGVNQELSNATGHDLPCSSPVLITDVSAFPKLRMNNRLSDIGEREHQKLGIEGILAILLGPLLLCCVILYLVSTRENRTPTQENEENQTPTQENNGKICNKDDAPSEKFIPDIDVIQDIQIPQTEIDKASSFVDADSNNLAKMSSLMNVHNCGMYPCYCCAQKKMTKFVQVGKNNRYPIIVSTNEAWPRPFVSMDIGNSLEESLEDYSVCTNDKETTSNNIDTNDEELYTIKL